MGIAMKRSVGALAGLAALATGLGQTATAQTPRVLVMVHGYDSRGVDTGKCLALNQGATLNTAPWIFIACNRADASQKFLFGSGSLGTLETQPLIGADGGRCVGVPTGANRPNGGWTVGAPLVATVDCINTQGQAATMWRLVGSVLASLPSPQPKYCLTFVQARGPAARLGDCSKPETLTHWDVVINP
jgi:hypothetical protein